MDISLLFYRGTNDRIGAAAHLLDASCIIQEEVTILTNYKFRDSAEKAFHGQRRSRQISVHLIVNDFGVASPVVPPHANITDGSYHRYVVGLCWSRDLEYEIPLTSVIAKSPPVARKL